MIDLHSHLLPDIDDGSRSAEQSVKVLAKFVEQEITDVVLTPHVRASDIAADPEDPLERRELAYRALRHAATDEPNLHLGFEIMMDQPLPENALKDRRFALAGSRYYLVEFPLSVVATLVERVVEGIVQGGGIPIIAHPERYDACSARVVARWRQAGAKVQVDATTLTRPTTRGHRARRLIAHGLADVMAADNHGDRRSLAKGAEYLRGRSGDIQAWILAGKNPSAVLQDEGMESVPPLRLKEGLLDKWKRLASG